MAEVAALSLNPVSVHGGDPLLGVLTIRNNTIPPETVFYGYILGSYDPSSDVFTPITFTADGVTYAWGSFTVYILPGPGTSAEFLIPTYAIEPSEVLTGIDALTFIANGGMNVIQADVGGAGLRIVGLNHAQFLQLYFRAMGVFEDVLNVSPVGVG